MPITHQRLTSIVDAGLSAYSAFSTLRKLIIQAESDFYAGTDPGKVLTQLFQLTRLTNPDIDGALLLGQEQNHLKETKHRNAKARERMRKHRLDHGLSTPTPNMSFIPGFGQPKGAPKQGGPLVTTPEAIAAKWGLTEDLAPSDYPDQVPSNEIALPFGLGGKVATFGTESIAATNAMGMPEADADIYRRIASGEISEAEGFAEIEALYADKPNGG